MVHSWPTHLSARMEAPGPSGAGAGTEVQKACERCSLQETTLLLTLRGLPRARAGGNEGILWTTPWHLRDSIGRSHGRLRFAGTINFALVFTSSLPERICNTWRQNREPFILPKFSIDFTPKEDREYVVPE